MERFITYSGNYEDIILYDILKNVERLTLGGLYIDVGCNDPFEESVTQIFYNMGWHGINIDPLRDKIKLYKIERPRDINICAGVSNKRGSLKYLSANTFSTFNPDNFKELEEYCKRYKIEYHYEYSEVWPLKDIICDNLRKGEDVIFLKIDVENYEKEVLESIDFNYIKPWIICIEAIVQMTGEDYYPWDSILLDAGYRFDKSVEGNRFYISSEHRELEQYSRSIEEIKNSYRIYKPLELNYIQSLYDAINKLKSNIYYRTGYVMLAPVRFIRKKIRSFGNRK